MGFGQSGEPGPWRFGMHVPCPLSDNLLTSLATLRQYLPMKISSLLMITMMALAFTVFAQQAGDHKPQKLRVSWGVIKGNLENKIQPELPMDGRGKPMHGNVVLRINIDRQGNVWRTARLDGKPELADAATNAVKQWKFKPYFLNGEPVEVETAVKLKLNTAHEALPVSPF
jgi:TonB family protein